MPISLSISLQLLLIVVAPVLAETLKFPDTPVKELSAEGQYKALTPASGVDPGKGARYFATTSSDEIGVVLIAASVPEASCKVLSGAPGVLSADKRAELGKRENPWILRYCAERGKPQIKFIGKHKALVVDFSQEQRIRILRGDQNVCTPATKYEAHAFVLKGDKVAHIYLISNVRTEPMPKVQEALASKFDALLASVKWQ